MKKFGVQCKRPRNPSEAAFYDACEKHGISMTRRGWPDYGCLDKDGRFFVVEVKPKRSARLKKQQMVILRILAAYGIRAYKWSPDGGFEPVRVDSRPSERDKYGLGYKPPPPVF